MIKVKNNRFKTVLIIFFVVILFFTFFSKTIYNSNLPTVTATFSQSGNLKNEITGSAEINYKDTWCIYGEMDGRVKQIFVAVGDEVKEGQTLMELKPDEGDKNVKVKAPKSGIILSVGIKEGMYISAMMNTVIFDMAKVSDKWEVALKIDSDKAEFVKKESQILIDIKDFSKTIQGELEAMHPYKNENGEEGYTVTINVKCNDKQIAGEMADVTIKNLSKVYDSILPAYALRKDSAGYYVLTLQEQDSVLGKYYIATRNSVDLLDSDEQSVAIMGVENNIPIIVSATDEIKDGDRVLYKESSGE